MTSLRLALATLVAVCVVLVTCLVSIPAVARGQITREEVRQLVAKGDPATKRTRATISFNGTEREYFVQLPHDYESRRTYWLLVAAHGGGGNGADSRVGRYGHWAERLGLEAIVVTPTFHQTNAAAVRFPSLGEDEFLKAVIADVKSNHKLQARILLTGYSRGGQFSHRFALQNPRLVFACAPQAAGSWTTPDGRFLMEGRGEIRNPSKALASMAPSDLQERWRANFDPRAVAPVAGLPAKPGAERIPFHVMCGTLDTRYEIALDFVASLKDSGYEVTTEWPRSPHGPTEPGHVEEWEKFRRRAIEFFLEVTAR
ncbi:MAG: hypothetical protein OXJ37_02585 [Bryobacterales bacterium]|nr:hypothetical protein [Bryobacterales bacterium]MDE0620772.1 hypothetical protein [Bryobacterales bacterium]